MELRNINLLVLLSLSLWSALAQGDPDYNRALKRAQYLLNESIPDDNDFQSWAGDATQYQSGVRYFIDHPNFYNVMLRYHERLFGTGLASDYLDELQLDDIDDKRNKFASISCKRNDGSDGRFRCYWSSRDEGDAVASCPTSWEQAVSVFWYPGVVAWACPSVVKACGSDLSRCFIEYANESEARNAEIGATEIFDSRFAVIKSLSRQSAGLATSVVVANYPYTKILEPGLTAVDGAIAHFYRQDHHFDLLKLSLPPDLLSIVQSMSLNDTRYRLVNTGATYEHAGVLTTFGWLRRYEKNRTRANQLYERLLCRQFTAELPRVFPQDPGNLRETPGCSGCHATLDPLADFFQTWGEGGDLYQGHQDVTETTFNNQSGSYVSDLANIIRNDNAFATCAVENVWEWLMGRKFYRDEADLRAAFTSYFVTTQYSFKELVYAVATHPAFVEGIRADATVGDPLEQPPLGEPPGGSVELPCDSAIDWATHIEPSIGLCTACHGGSGGRIDLRTEAAWAEWASQSVNMMASGNMPPGQAGPPSFGAVWELKEAVRCWQEQSQ